MKYELKAFFRSKLVIICVFICILLSIQILFPFFKNIEQHELDYTQKHYEREEAIYKEEIRLIEDQWDYTLNLCTTEEKKQAFFNEYEFTKWSRDYCREIIDYGNSAEYDPEVYEDMSTRKSIISLMANCNMCSPAEMGCTDMETYFAEGIERHEDLLRLEELPFRLSLLSDSPFMTREQKETKVPYYYNLRLMVKVNLELLDYENAIRINDASPWTYLQRICSRSEYPVMVFGCLAILLPAFYMMESKRNRSFQFQELIPRKKLGTVWYYYRSIFSGVLLTLFTGVVLITLGLGICYGWGNLETPAYVDPVNFTSMTTPYVRVVPQVRGYMNLGKVYYDTMINGEVVETTLYEFINMPLWKVLGYAGILFFTKMVFLTLTGFTIGYLVKKPGKTVFLASVTATAYVAGQVIKTGMKWNPFAVKSGWDVAVGGCNTTWLNAMVVLGISIIALLILLYVRQGKRE